MLANDVEMLMCHCRNSLSANGGLLGAMIRIKRFVEEAQKTPTNSRYKAAIEAKLEYLETATPEQVGRGFISWCEGRLNSAKAPNCA